MLGLCIHETHQVKEQNQAGLSAIMVERWCTAASSVHHLASQSHDVVANASACTAHKTIKMDGAETHFEIKMDPVLVMNRAQATRHIQEDLLAPSAMRTACVHRDRMSG